jgi:hypothetical protein
MKESQMFNAINSKLLLVIALTLASIAGALAFQNVRHAQRDAQEAKARAEDAKAQAELQNALKTNSHNWGGSADTIKKYRPK